jgi:hypothetical protein
MQHGTKLSLHSQGEPTTFVSKQITTLVFKLGFNPISGKGTFDIAFQPSERLARSGVALLGAYRNDDEVVASFMAHGDDNLEVDYKTPLLIGTLFEPVAFRQIDTTIAGGTVNVVQSKGGAVAITPTAKKRRSKKT